MWDSYIWKSVPGANNTRSGNLYTGNQSHPTGGTQETRTLIRFSLDSIPQGAIVQSATLGFNVFVGPSQNIHIHRMTSSWSEAGGTSWTALSTAYDPAVQGSFTAHTGAVTADVTGLVGAWVSGASPNYGFMLINADTMAQDGYRSSEFGTQAYRPSLQVCYINY